jgi:hypothetical protein
MKEILTFLEELGLIFKSKVELLSYLKCLDCSGLNSYIETADENNLEDILDFYTENILAELKNY